jgi:hypothetical protein
LDEGGRIAGVRNRCREALVSLSLRPAACCLLLLRRVVESTHTKFGLVCLAPAFDQRSRVGCLVCAAASARRSRCCAHGAVRSLALAFFTTLLATHNTPFARGLTFRRCR